jgi:hypothetical protein
MDLDIVANDIAVVPGTSTIAVADARKFVAFVDTATWDVTAGFGRNVNPKKKQDDSIPANAIAAFTVDEDVYVCVVDTDRNCLRIATSDGLVDAVVGLPGGAAGMLPLQFDEPCCVACSKPHRPPRDGEDASLHASERDPFHPSWYVSGGAADDDVERMLLSEPAYRGKFYVCPRALRPPPVDEDEDTAPNPHRVSDDDRRGVQEGRRYGVPKTPPADVAAAADTAGVIPNQLYDLFYISNEWTDPMEITHRIILARPTAEAQAVSSKAAADERRRVQRESQRAMKKDKSVKELDALEVRPI